MSTQDERARELLDRALDYACRIRDDDPTTVHADLRALSRADLEGTACVLAALVPDDRTPQQLLAWCETTVEPATAWPTWRAAHARFSWLRTHGEPIPLTVADGERSYQREIARRKRARPVEGAA